MKREIKYRGRDKKGTWWYGSLAYFQDSRSAHIIPCGSCKGDDVVCDFVEVDPDTLGQYTGLKDRKGREIYEGDILHIKRYRNDFFNESKEFRDAFDIEELKGELEAEFTAEVVFEEGAFFYGDHYMAALFGNQKHSQPIQEIELIGNVFDNPELLEGKE